MIDDENSIPAELRDRDQWLLWSAQSDPPKCPLNADGQPASWTDPGEWLSFERACELACDCDEFEGVGFVIAENDPLCGLDLDGCIRDPGEHETKEWLPRLTPLLGTYCEFSTSGTGVHVIAEDTTIPSWWSDTHTAEGEHEGVEAYEQKFFIMTGDALGGAPESVAGVELGEWLTDAWLALNNELPASHPQAELPDHVTAGGDDADEDRAREALSHIDPDVGYGRWRNIAYALVDYFDGDTTARRVFVDWSRRGSKWDTDAERQADKIFENATPGGGVSAGTLFYYAQQNGWEPSSGPTESGAPDRPDEVADWEQVKQLYANQGPKHGRQAAAAALLTEHDFATPMDTEHLWAYDPDSGMFERNGAAMVHKILSANLGVYDTQTERREILSKLKARSYIRRDEFDGGDENLLCCANGVLNLETREMSEHDPDHLFTRAIPVEYDPDAEAPAVRRFLDDITRRPEDKLTLLEMLGAALWPAPVRNKFLILFGEGANGKSTWFETATALLGSDNTSGWELQNLSENRFAASDLVGKFANIAPDMPGTKLTELGTLKTLTGDDTTMVEAKGEPAFPMRNQATLMFGANRPPVIPESSRAIKRRLVPVRLPYEYTNEDDDNPDARDAEELLAELTTDEQLSGLLNMALDGLDRLREQGDVSLPEGHDERLEYYEQFSDPIKEFRVTCLTNEQGTEVKKSVVYDAYKRFCRSQGYNVKDARVFWRTLRQTTLTYDEGRPERNGERVRVLNSTKFTATGLEHAPNELLDGDQLPTKEVAALNAGDSGVSVEVLVTAVDTDQPDRITSKAQLEDESGEVEAVVWSDATATLEEKGCYRLRGVHVDEYQGDRQLNISAETTAESIQRGAGNTPSANATQNEDLNTAADGGQQVPDWREEIVSFVGDQDGPVPESAIVEHVDEDEETVRERIETLLENGRLIDVPGQGVTT